MVLASLLTLSASGAARGQAEAPGVEAPPAFREAMRTAGEAWASVASLVDSPAYLLNSARGDVLGQVGVIRRQTSTVRALFEARSVREALPLVTAWEEALVDLEAEVGRATPDQAAALEALAAVRDTCVQCHRQFRTGDRDHGYRLRVPAP